MEFHQPALWSQHQEVSMWPSATSSAMSWSPWQEGSSTQKRSPAQSTFLMRSTPSTRSGRQEVYCGCRGPLPLSGPQNLCQGGQGGDSQVRAGGGQLQLDGDSLLKRTSIWHHWQGGHGSLWIFPITAPSKYQPKMLQVVCQEVPLVSGLPPNSCLVRLRIISCLREVLRRLEQAGIKGYLARFYMDDIRLQLQQGSVKEHPGVCHQGVQEQDGKSPGLKANLHYPTQ